MASTNSTTNLKLCQWIGSDKPKMADFNSDNVKLDAAFTAAKPVTGTYVGDGESAQVVNLGFVPSFGIVFGVGQLLTAAIGSTGNMKVGCACFSSAGCSQGAFLADGTSGLEAPGERGFGVLTSGSIVSGRVAQLNESGVTYAYLAFR